MNTFETHVITYAESKKQLSYISAGPSNGPLLIFLHGWPAIGKTWAPQLNAFASLGFRVLAPDMPGYGGSTANRNTADYAQEVIVQGLLALLASTGKRAAIWAAHDWGCGTCWTLAATHPQACLGVINMCLPYRTLELGLEELIKTVDRDLYPVTEYPNGPWDYQAYYEQSFEKAVAWHNSDIPGFLRTTYRKGSSATFGKPSFTSTIIQDGGWLGGALKPLPADALPAEGRLLWPELEQDVVAAMEKTTFFSADAWYMNHAANRAYNLGKGVNGGVLTMPVLFIGAKWDAICEVESSALAEPMRKFCTNLTEVMIDAGHWVALDKPEQVNAAITRWLVEELKSEWPGFWKNRFVSNTSN
ncbi:hypothetical protein M409DRAFT_30563 [Zasmidium cellare ATCC 36951]|uniref:AB hydrolase-1 domain-containing protein n=1 Tax=Zasmidium cellare ATCC 36951 TaxID=1080233 RepID=A0A6A6BVW8_ZASCE|nr:uncharacterized protein M409DRAFT_30563 [Zasmidium cellare ATCC 36951]KAF2158931.1 hypothetical protein M409DRAFT_30563 [Zasmidium cellare ATCC 36951]